MSLLDRTQVALGLRQVSPDEAALLATSAGSLAEDLRMEEEAAPQYVKDVLAAIRQGPVLPVRGTLHPSLCILVHLMYICVVHLLYLLQASAFLLDLEVVAAHHAFATNSGGKHFDWKLPESLRSGNYGEVREGGGGAGGGGAGRGGGRGARGAGWGAGRGRGRAGYQAGDVASPAAPSSGGAGEEAGEAAPPAPSDSAAGGGNGGGGSELATAWMQALRVHGPQLARYEASPGLGLAGRCIMV